MSLPQEPPQNVLVKVKVSAPGKVILHGEYAVVFQKLALAASLGLRTEITLEETSFENVGFLIIQSDALKMRQTYNLSDLSEFLAVPVPLQLPPIGEFTINTPTAINHEIQYDKVKKFVQEKSSPDGNLLTLTQQQSLETFFYLFFSILSTEKITKLRPMVVQISTALTVSAGTGSSASFAVATAAALLRYVTLKKTPVLPTTSFDHTDLETISKWGFEGERIIHGTPSGVDNTVCTFGGLVAFRRNSPPGVIELKRNIKVILVNTLVARDTKKMIAKFHEFRESYPKIVDGVMELVEEATVEAKQCLLKINENAGVEESNQEFEKLTELSEINHNLLRCVGVSHPKLEEVLAVLSEYFLKGKLTGAGGGGYAICIVPPYAKQKTVLSAISSLNCRGFEAVLTDLGGSGVAVDK